jgi:small subunit ribosomal protein S6
LVEFGSFENVLKRKRSYNRLQSSGHTRFRASRRRVLRHERRRKLKSYELLILTRSGLTEEERDSFVKRIEDWLKAAGSNIAESKYLGVRKLAYPIKKHDEAGYTLWLVDAPPEMPAELSTKIRIDEDVLRHLLIERHRLAKNEIITESEE